LLDFSPMPSIMRDDAIVFEAPAEPGKLSQAGAGSRIWAVGALVRAVADALEARFNPVAVKGEIANFSRAASGHCYFSLKDEAGQIRCAMFRRAASLLDFQPREGDLVEVRGRLGVYEPRGDLQLIVESLAKAGQGTLFEQFVKLKAKLEAEGLFDASRKRAIPARPRGIGLVTSLGAAALQDVSTALARRVPHIPVWLAPASVQGAGAPAELTQALQKLYQRIEETCRPAADLASENTIDVILLVRGGGSIEDLWAFNDEQLARTLAQSPVPIISGVGHETDFTIADFVADLRAPTPTAAAELCAQEREALLLELDQWQDSLHFELNRRLDTEAQRLDRLGWRIARPQEALMQQREQLSRLQQRLRMAPERVLRQKSEHFRQLVGMNTALVATNLIANRNRLELLGARLEALNVQRTLERGYALLQTPQGEVVRSVQQVSPGQALKATVADGEIPLSSR
jgi:exodeoxyribonuclease VII large subunit